MGQLALPPSRLKLLKERFEVTSIKRHAISVF